MYTASLISDHRLWESFVAAQPFQPFLMSAAYIDFYESLGERGYIVGIHDGNTLVGGTIVLTTHAKRGSFLYVPYGPLMSDTADEKELLRALCAKLKELAYQERCHFIRVSPFLDDTAARRALWLDIGFQKAPLHALAEDTWLLDVTPDADQLLAAMNKNHRNLIRRCERDGVTIRMETTSEHLIDLHELLDTTAKRHKFHRFSRSYIDKEFAAYADNGHAVLFRAYLPDGRLDAAAVIMYYGNMAAYRHSGSLGLDARLPTSYLLQWHAILEAKRRGIPLYNFWGIAPDTASKSHPFFGITHFKKGFGGFPKRLLPCQDLPLDWTYTLTKAVEIIRRLKRGF